MKRSPLIRKTALRKKRLAPRRVAARCKVRGCKRRWSLNVQVTEGAETHLEPYCLTHAKKEADRLFSLAVRAVGRCQRCGATDGLQCSHFISRRYLGTRYDFRNAECLCLRCHKFLTERPLEAAERSVSVLGPMICEELRQRARSFVGPLDYGEIIAGLRS